MHNLFLVYLSISTCFGQPCAHHQEKQLCLCDTRYLLFCVDDCLVCRVEFHPAYQKYSVLVILCGWRSGMQGGIPPFIPEVLGTCYSVWMTVWYAGWNSTLHTRPSSTQNNKYWVSHKHSCFSWWWAHGHPKHVEIDKHTKNKLCSKLALFTRLCGV